MFLYVERPVNNSARVPTFGRTSIYVATFAMFVMLLIPTSLVKTFAGLLALRFLLGFFGSPCLAVAGASFQDIVCVLH